MCSSDLRRGMANNVGVVRDAKGLGRLLAQITAMDAKHGPALPLVAARLVVEAALDRQESRGAHFRTDFPTPAAEAVHTSMARAPGPSNRRKAA